MLGELFNAMKEERRKYYACHPACEYRKRKADGRMHCLNDDSSVDIIDENANYDLCPLPIDYYSHMERFYAEILTDKGLIRLRIISGEPLYVMPALEKYIKWLKKRRKSVQIWSIPTLERERKVKVEDLTDAVYAEFLLSKKEKEAIDILIEEYYLLFEKTLPERLKLLSMYYRHENVPLENPGDSFFSWFGPYWDSEAGLTHILSSALREGEISGWILHDAQQAHRMGVKKASRREARSSAIMEV